jgi:Putative metallopeptidase
MRFTGRQIKRLLLAFGASLASILVVAEELPKDAVSLNWSKPALERDYLALQTSVVAEAADELNTFISQSLVLNSPLSFLVTAELEKYYAPERREIHLPVSSLYQIVEGSQAKYPQQKDVQQEIISASLKHLFFSEFANALVQELSIAMVGWDRERIDGFALLSQLNGVGSEHLFILDAAEEYLLVDRWRPVLDANQFTSEFAADEFRYRQMVCLVQGFEAHHNVVEHQGSETCLASYLREVDFWLGALKDHLAPKSVITSW